MSYHVNHYGSLGGINGSLPSDRVTVSWDLRGESPRPEPSVVVDVPRGPGATMYVRIGDVFAWIAGLAGLALVAWRVSRKFG